MSAKQFPKNGFRQPPFLIRPSAARRSVYDLLRDGHNIRLIEKPWLQSLSAALEEVGDFDFLLCHASDIIFPKTFLEALPGPALNLHPAMLPGYRGAMPVHAMVLNDEADEFGGMTLHLIEPKIDQGAIVAQQRVPRSNYASPGAWTAASTEAATPLIVDALPAFLDGKIKPQPQDAQSGSYFSLKDVPLYASPTQTYDYIERYMTRMPQLQRWQKLQLTPLHQSKPYTVATPVEHLGPPTGKPALVSRKTIEFDAVDARVRVRRIGLFEKRWMKLTGNRPNTVMPPRS
ncbi:MAG: formyltransferase family protein [Pseudomonadota bacterium]